MIPVCNIVEQKIQEELSQIRLLDPAYLPVFIEEFEKLMEELIIKFNLSKFGDLKKMLTPEDDYPLHQNE